MKLPLNLYWSDRRRLQVRLFLREGFSLVSLPTIYYGLLYCSYLQAPQDVLELTAAKFDIADK